MCGIAGFLSWSSNSVAPSVLSGMGNALRHRGPDDEGFAIAGSSGFRLFSGPDSVPQVRHSLPPLESAAPGPCGMAFRRLSILDLSESGHQPMLSPDGQIALSFNGEIYNFKRLRQELEQQGYQFHSQTDTEVILAGYQLHGIEFIYRLNGMFAIALCDLRLHRLFLIRDRLGIKPLHYCRQGGALFWASEIKALFASGQISAKPRWDALFATCRLEATPAPASCFEGISTLAPGCYLEIDITNGHSLEHTYWEIPFPEHKIQISKQEAAEVLEAHLKRIVESQMIADAPVISMLSGGVDSSLLSAISNELRPGWHAYTMSFAAALTAFNELPQAQTTARHLGLIHEVDEADILALASIIPLALSHYEQPYAGIDPQMLAACFLRQRQYKVIINGAGADELFGGYAYYFTWQRWQQRKKMAWAAPFIPPSGHFLTKLKTVLELKQLTDFYWYQRGGISMHEWTALTGRQPNPILPPVPEGLEEWPIQDAIAFLDLKHNIGNHHCFREDLAYMSFSIESRYPFLDHELVEWAASLPTDVRFSLNENKPLVRAVAAKYIPKEVLDMPKKGFNLPFAEWVARQPEWEHLAAQKIQALLRRGIFRPRVIDSWWRQRHSAMFDKVWLLVNIETWLSHYVDGKPGG